jgi:hypothetical protein
MQAASRAKGNVFRGNEEFALLFAAALGQLKPNAINRRRRLKCHVKSVIVMSARNAEPSSFMRSHVPVQKACRIQRSAVESK